MNIRLLFKRNIRFLRLTGILICLLLPATALANPLPANETPKTSRYSLVTPEIIRSDELGIVFNLRTPEVRIDKNDGVNIDGLENSISTPGHPQLPYYKTFIAVPPGADASVIVKESGLINVHTKEIQPAARFELGGIPAEAEDLLPLEAGSIFEDQPIYEKEKSIYGSDAYYPIANYEISGPFYLRDLRLFEIKLFPLRYNPVTSILEQATDLSVKIKFANGMEGSRNNLPGYVDRQSQVWREKILNFNNSGNWRGFPDSVEGIEAITLPIGKKTYKIEVNEDGIYEILGSDLADAGMVLPVNPASIKMMQRGQNVSFQYIDVNNNSQFDSTDKIRFFGWAFDGSRYEDLYVTNNIFWLWSDGSGPASTINNVANQAGSGFVQATSFKESITKWPHNAYFSAWAIDWDSSPNDPTNWHWDRVVQNTPKNFLIDLPNPVSNSTGNTYLVEFTTRLNPFSVSSLPTYTAKTYFNNYVNIGQATWTGHQNVNITNTFPGSEFNAGSSNTFKVEITNNNNNVTAEGYVTRITVNYERQLTAVSNQLIFNKESAGQTEFHVNGFSEGNPSKILVWNLTNRYQPTQINMTAQNIQGTGSNIEYLIGSTHGANAKFIATNDSNVLSPKDISEYVAASLNPAGGSGVWLAITHPSMKAAADVLADHRKLEYTTFVAKTTDVINQYGYGFNTPTAIKDYLKYAVENWTGAPEYLTLFGDATVNPRNLDCSTCSVWDKNSPTFLVTDIAFNDRWSGTIPTDFPYTLLINNDLIPDISVGRIPSNSLSEANLMVQKIINYENQRVEPLADWQKSILFVADNADSGGNFCFENQQTGTLIPNDYDQTHLCLPAPTVADTNALRNDMSHYINDLGVSILNYRGHGSRYAWADTSASPAILDTSSVGFWLNGGRSVIILSADCLDGYFADPGGVSALGETFIRLNNVGSVGHWSSAGLGFSSEHSVLHAGFYEGLFTHNLNKIGDAINYAKIKYYSEGRYPSELFAFIYLGDPAMFVFPAAPTGVHLPAVLAP